MSNKELKELNARTKANRERSAALEKQLKADKEFDNYLRLSLDGIFFMLGMTFAVVIVFAFC